MSLRTLGGGAGRKGFPARRGVGVSAPGVLRPVRGREAWEYHEPGPLAFSQSGPPNPNPGKQAYWHGHAVRTSTKKLWSEKLRAGFSFPKVSDGRYRKNFVSLGQVSPGKKSIHHRHGTPPLSVCHPTSYGVYLINTLFLQHWGLCGFNFLRDGLYFFKDNALSRIRKRRVSTVVVYICDPADQLQGSLGPFGPEWFRRVSPRVSPKTGVSDRVSHGVSPGPKGPRAPECPKSVPRVFPECLGYLFDTPGTLSGHSFDTPEPPGAAKGPGDTPWDTLSDTPPFSGTLSETLPGTTRARRARETPVAGRRDRKHCIYLATPSPNGQLEAMFGGNISPILPCPSFPCFWENCKENRQENKDFLSLPNP